MWTDSQRNRVLGRHLSPLSQPRLILLTGARQTGKTTLALARYPELRYVNLDSPEERERIRAVRADAWADSVGEAILDEAQKEPSLFDKVKFAFDAGKIGRTVLLGSSQILMLQRVRETLAGRAFVYAVRARVGPAAVDARRRLGYRSQGGQPSRRLGLARVAGRGRGPRHELAWRSGRLQRHCH